MESQRSSRAMSAGKRPRRGEAAGRALVSAWRVSGLSQAAFARQAKVPEQRIGYWRLRLSGLEASASSGFVEITSAAGARCASPSGMLVELSDSVRVRVEPGFDPALLRAVVRALATEASC